MGNRAVITTESKRIGVYLHWNGGRDSIEPFLNACKELGYRAPENDNYGWARLCQLIGNFFGGSHSIGIDRLDNLDCDNGDNGVYIIKDWKIIGREHHSGSEQTGYNVEGFTAELVEMQRASEKAVKEIQDRDKQTA